MKAVQVQLSPADYKWLSEQAKQHNTTVSAIIEKLVQNAETLTTTEKNRIKNLQTFVKQPKVFTDTDVTLLRQIIQWSREGQVIPPELLGDEHESPSRDNDD